MPPKKHTRRAVSRGKRQPVETRRPNQRKSNHVNPEMEPQTARDDNDDNVQQAVQQLQAQADKSNVIFNPPSHNSQFTCILSPHPPPMSIRIILIVITSTISGITSIMPAGHQPPPTN